MLSQTPESLKEEFSAKKRVIIVGMGPGGLSAAIGAARKGYEVLIIDNRDYFSRTQVVVLDENSKTLLTEMAREYLSNSYPEPRDPQTQGRCNALAKEFDKFLEKVRNGHASISSIQDFLKAILPNSVIALQGPQYNVEKFDLSKPEKVLILMKNEGEEVREYRYPFHHFVAADGAKRMMAQKLNLARKETQQSEIIHQPLEVQARKVAHSVLNLRSNLRDEQGNTVSLGQDDLKKRHKKFGSKDLPHVLPQLERLGWTEPFFPSIGFHPNSNNTIFHFSCEIPESILKLPEPKKRQKLLEWTKLLLNLVYGGIGDKMELNTEDENAPTIAEQNKAKERNKMKSTAFEVNLSYAVTPFLDLGEATYSTMGDAASNPYFFLGHGANDAIADAVDWSNCLPDQTKPLEKDKIFDSKSYISGRERRTKNLIDRVYESHEEDLEKRYSNFSGEVVEQMVKYGEDLLALGTLYKEYPRYANFSKSVDLDSRYEQLEQGIKTLAGTYEKREAQEHEGSMREKIEKIKIRATILDSIYQISSEYINAIYRAEEMILESSRKELQAELASLASQRKKMFKEEILTSVLKKKDEMIASGLLGPLPIALQERSEKEIEYQKLLTKEDELQDEIRDILKRIKNIQSSGLEDKPKLFRSYGRQLEALAALSKKKDEGILKRVERTHPEELLRDLFFLRNVFRLESRDTIMTTLCLINNRLIELGSEKSLFQSLFEHPEILKKDRTILPELLKRKDFMLNKKDSDLLMTALKKRYDKDFILALIEKEGIQLNQIDWEGLNPLMIALKYEYDPMVIFKLLEREDININVSNKKGETALSIAIKNKYDQSIIQAIKKKIILSRSKRHPKIAKTDHDLIQSNQSLLTKEDRSKVEEIRQFVAQVQKEFEKNKKEGLVKLEEYKKEKGVIFDVDENLNLIKISRKNNGPKFSVVFSKDHQPFILYRGKSHEGEERSLGKGHFGRVKLAQNYDTHELVAVKIQSDKTQGEREKEVLGMVSSENVKGHLTRKTDREKHYLFQPLRYGENAKNMINKFTVGQALDFFRLAAEEVHLLHRSNLIHRDLHLDNFMFDSGLNEVHLVDLGHAVVSVKGNESIVIQDSTKALAAPEVAKGKQYSKKSDIYAFGKLMEEILEKALKHYTEKGQSKETIESIKILEDAIKKMTYEDVEDRAENFIPLLEALDALQRQADENLLSTSIIKDMSKAADTSYGGYVLRKPPPASDKGYESRDATPPKAPEKPVLFTPLKEAKKGEIVERSATSYRSDDKMKKSFLKDLAKKVKKIWRRG